MNWAILLPCIQETACIVPQLTLMQPQPHLALDYYICRQLLYSILLSGDVGLTVRGTSAFIDDQTFPPQRMNLGCIVSKREAHCV